MLTLANGSEVDMRSFIERGEEAVQQEARQIKITGTVSDVFRNAIVATMVGEQNANNQEAILEAAAMESAQQEASIFAILASKLDNGHKLIDPWEELQSNDNNTLLITVDATSELKDNDVFDVRTQLRDAEDQNYSQDSGLVLVGPSGEVNGNVPPMVMSLESYARSKGFKVYHVKKKK